jgi:hypothetical protein
VELICPFCSVQIVSEGDDVDLSTDFYECPNCHKIVDLQSLKESGREKSVETFLNIENLERSERMRTILFVVGITVLVLGVIGFWIYYLGTH